MPQKAILLSGATGFLGSHLAEHFSSNGYMVLALVRNTSNLSRLQEFLNNNVILVNTDTGDHLKLLSQTPPSCFIHAAWQGVSAEGRNDLRMQNDNIALTVRLLSLARELKIKKVIALGSQAEYGNFNGRISENAVCQPVSAYGAAKLLALKALQTFCEEHEINWYWLRIFTVYGTREEKKWLLPSVIRTVLKDETMDLTACEQRYDYLYVSDFCRALMKMVETDRGSGVYNLSSNTSMPIKTMIETIRKIAKSKATLNFGALPYRPDQVMHMEGDSTKFNEEFHFKTETNLDKNLEQMIAYYKGKE